MIIGFTEALCPPVPTVNFVNTCTRQIGSTCAYTCPSGFAPTKRSAMCLEGAVWDMKDDEFCRGELSDSLVTSNVARLLRH